MQTLSHSFSVKLITHFHLFLWIFFLYNFSRQYADKYTSSPIDYRLVTFFQCVSLVKGHMLSFINTSHTTKSFISDKCVNFNFSFLALLRIIEGFIYYKLTHTLTIKATRLYGSAPSFKLVSMGISVWFNKCGEMMNDTRVCIRFCQHHLHKCHKTFETTDNIANECWDFIAFRYCGFFERCMFDRCKT